MNSQRMYTETEARQIAVSAAQEALTRFAATHPLPATISVDDAAEMLGVSRRTVARMDLPRTSAGRIAYATVLNVLAAR
jgi:hypothetical protein